jgi:hypothetical protein
MDTHRDPFDFDAWRQLSENDPDAFEARRREVIEAEISQTEGHSRSTSCGDVTSTLGSQVPNYSQ